MHEHNNSFNRTLIKLVTILTKCFFPYLNPTSYLNIIKEIRRRSPTHSIYSTIPVRSN